MKLIAKTRNRIRFRLQRLLNPKVIDLNLQGYHSQWGQDKFIADQLFKRKRDGFFVDIGANDGITMSNSFHFEKELGWQGICIEPLPKVFAKLKETRNCILVEGGIAKDEGKMEFLAIEGHAEMLSGIVDKYDKYHLERVDREIKEYGGTKSMIEVQCYNLNNLLKAHGVENPDYLSLDTEGGEEEILKSIDFSTHRFSVISVENNSRDGRFKKILNPQGYQLIAFAGCDEIFCLPEISKNISS